jgi:lysophospholipase L1-like esterase
MRDLSRAARVGAAAVLTLLAPLLAGCSSGPPGRAGGAHTADPRPSHRQTSPWNTHPATIAALGDSITRGFDDCSLLKDCPQVSWATGTNSEVSSLAERLGARSWNFAVTGSRMSALNAQASRAAAVRPQLVTVLMGANDACRALVGDMTAVAQYRSEFTAAMDTLHRTSPQTEVYVSSIPDLARLWSVGHLNPLGAQIWNLGICPAMLAHSQSLGATDQARRDTVRARVIAYNAALREVCGQYPRCRYDDGAVFRYPFTTNELSSWDWFHPGPAGQARLAQLAYQGVTRG